MLMLRGYHTAFDFLLAVMLQRAVQFLAVAGALLLTNFIVQFLYLEVSGSHRSAPLMLDKAGRMLTRQEYCPKSSAAIDATTPFPSNFWYVKTFKTGSTTLSSVFNSICVHYGVIWLRWDTVKTVAQLKNLGPSPTPLDLGMRQAIDRIHAATDIQHVAITNHIPYSEGAARQFKQPLLRFTSVRHPVARVHSHFVQSLCFQTATQLGWVPGSPAGGSGVPGPSGCDFNTTYLELALRHDTLQERWKYAGQRQNLMFRYIKGSQETVQGAADQYDFIFVSERMNEALVIFMLDFGLNFADIAYLPSKNRTGKYKTAKDMPQDLNDYILANNQQDLHLWDLANRRLDQRRAQLKDSCGADIVAIMLNNFEQLLRQVSAECSQYVEWYSAHAYPGPFTYTGVPGLGDESGLGFRCVRHVARHFIGQPQQQARHFIGQPQQQARHFIGQPQQQPDHQQPKGVV